MSSAEQEVIYVLNTQLHKALDKLDAIREMAADTSTFTDDEGDFRARLVAILTCTPHD